MECFSKNASKYHAALYLKEHFGFDKVVGFGDNLNDIPLFNACYECYAVENANNELKRLATGVIKSNQQDGVARWLENNLLK